MELKEKLKVLYEKEKEDLERTIKLEVSVITFPIRYICKQYAVSKKLSLSNHLTIDVIYFV